MKKIIARPLEEEIEVRGSVPKRAAFFLPEWYKKMTPYRDNKKKFWVSPEGTTATVKKCIPLLDAMTAGYTIYTDEEYLVTKDQNGVSMLKQATNSLPMIGSHPAIQYEGMQIPSEYISEIAFKWQPYWSITPPKGYSLFFTHPVNRIDLPFFTLSGFVDADKYTGPVGLPFFLRKDFEGIIPIGTPIAQFFPIKRESWKIEQKPFEIKGNLKRKSIPNTFIEFYKKNFWVKKDYS